MNYTRDILCHKICWHPHSQKPVGLSSCPEVSAMPATLDTMTDAELDARLIRLFKQHRAAEGERRKDWHRCIAGVLAEQSVRLDRWLAER